MASYVGSNDGFSFFHRYVIQLTQASDYFLCPNSANVYQVDFIAFKIRNLDDGQVLFEVRIQNNSTIFDESVYKMMLCSEIFLSSIGNISIVLFKFDSTTDIFE